MTELELSIVDTVARAAAEGLEATSIYLRPEQIDQLGGIEQAGGLPVRRLAGNGRPRIYTRYGQVRNIPEPRRPRRTGL